jgi:uncharacterized Ntn-hydrolase superfamily protein
MKMLRILIILFFIQNSIFAQSVFKITEPLAHTYSIVARDTITGDMGVAVQSHWFSVGSIVSWGEAGVGVVATQSFVNPAFGPKALTMLKAGMTSKQTLDILIANDEGRDYRQLAILDINGNVASYTGKLCIDAAGHIEGKNYAVQANMMKTKSVWPEMAKAFETADGSLAERLMAALEAGEAAGGDIRGKQSIAILVVGAKSTGQPWVDRKLDLRIADHPTPLKEMKRLLKVHKAYGHMNAGDLAVEHGDEEGALREYGAAEALFPDNEEMKYWHAVSLANMQRLDEALPLFKEVFAKNSDWKDLTNRIIKNGLLKINPAQLELILGF